MWETWVHSLGWEDPLEKGKATLSSNLVPAMQKTPIQSLGQEDFLEEEMATHSSILAWDIP